MGRFANELSSVTKQALGQALTGVERIGAAFAARPVDKPEAPKSTETPQANAFDLLFVTAVLVGIPFFAGLFLGPCGAVLGAAVDSVIVGDAALRVAKKDRQSVTNVKTNDHRDLLPSTAAD